MKATGIDHRKNAISPISRPRDGDVEGPADKGLSVPSDEVQKCHIKDLPLPTFTRCNERLQRPVIVVGVCGTWRGIERKTLSLKYLERKFGEHQFRILGQQGNTTERPAKLSDFAEYAASRAEPFPFGVIDYKLIERKFIKHEYDIPSLFRDDLFRYLDDSHCLPKDLKNLIILPKYGGYYCNNYNGLFMSWTACCEGKLKFVLFPRHVDFKKLTTSQLGHGMRHVREWFETALPRIKQTTTKDMWPLEGVLNPGDILFRPIGWQMVCIGTKRPATTLLTYRYVSPTNLSDVWQRYTVKNPAVTRALLSELRRKRPELVAMLLSSGVVQQIVPSSGSSSSSSSSEGDSASCSRTCVSSTSYSSETLDSSDNS